ncbi:MAG: dihydropteroate synthase [Pseudomonadota bacterium]|nr:dihydropteroate synthase [Pseudomonadota bacterium]
MIWQTARFRIDLGEPRVMGIVNLTPDSFSDGDPSGTPASALATCERLLREGADLLDLGAESSRPGAEPIGAELELARLLPVLREAVRFGCPVSVDTVKAEVMRRALALGADVVNDVSALRGTDALAAVASHPSCGVCLMHMRGTSATMHAETQYDDVVGEVVSFLRERVVVLEREGVRRDRIVVDPGIGFAKTAAQNMELLARQKELLGIGVPLLIGWSRKSTLARLSGVAATASAERTPRQRALLDAASVAAALLAVERGARIVRVHDVAGTVAALAVWKAAAGRPIIRAEPIDREPSPRA